MKQYIAQITLLVEDYDDAIAFYTRKLEFELIEDTQLDAYKRWVLVRPPNARECCLLLSKVVNNMQKNSIGNQSGGGVFLFLYTDDLWDDYTKMREQGVKFIQKPREEAYGTVVVFEDLYGNRWDLLEPKA